MKIGLACKVRNGYVFLYVVFLFRPHPPILFIFTVFLFRHHFVYFFHGTLIQDPYLFNFFSLDCAIELNILSNEDMGKLRNRQMFKNESDSLRIKMALGIINFCVNMLNIQGEATKSALKFLLSSVYKRKCNINLSRESSFTENDESVPGCSKDSDDKGSSSHRGRICEPIAGYSKYTDESPKGIMLSSIMKEPKMSAAENTIISEVETNGFDDIHFDLDTFVNQDEDFNDHYKECRKIDFLTLMDIFRDDESNE